MKNQNLVVAGKRILLVDDEAQVRETVRLLLNQDGHVVVEANNGAEAFRLFINGHFDLVLTDAHMPFVTGDELAERIRSVAPEQPILMITSHGYAPGRGNPVDEVLDKPFDLNGLRAAISRVLHSREDLVETAFIEKLEEFAGQAA
jgi:DNA-binding response OmpR family regulator